jgi:prepilin-type processing-associated H-X9-DG protein
MNSLCDGTRARVFEVAILFQCECGKEFQTGDEDAGRRARCPACKRELIVPQPKPVFDDELGTLHEPGPRPTSGKAIASLLLGLGSFVLCFFTGIPAIFLGIFGLNDINNPRKHVKGKGLAITGIVLGGITSTLVVPAMLIALLLPAIQAAREAARRLQCTNNLKQIALAMHRYAAANGESFPPAAIYDKRGKPLLSWRVLILPHLGQDSLYQKFHLDEPWDSPHNKPLVDQIPAPFQCPSEPMPGGQTTYEVVVDPRSLFTGEPSGVKLGSVTDGTSNTILVMEAASPVPWSKPEDLSLSADEPALEMGSKHPGGLNVSMADGSIRFFKNSVENPFNPRVLKDLITRNGGEQVTPP